MRLPAFCLTCGSPINSGIEIGANTTAYIYGLEIRGGCPKGHRSGRVPDGIYQILAALPPETQQTIADLAGAAQRGDISRDRLLEGLSKYLSGDAFNKLRAFLIDKSVDIAALLISILAYIQASEVSPRETTNNYTTSINTTINPCPEATGSILAIKKLAKKPQAHQSRKQKNQKHKRRK